jgi:ribosomal protein S18 acetylase RimI-like enzyme
VRQAGGVVHEDPQLTWISTGARIRFYNGVIRTRLDPADADRVIHAVADEFRERDWLMAWWVMPNSHPADLAPRLAAQGFTLWDGDLGMAADLDAIPDGAPPPTGVTIERIRTEAGLEDWLRAFGEGFGVPEAALADYARLPRGVAPEQSLFRYYLARADGVPAGTALWFPAQDAAVLDEIATVPPMRRRGIANAVTYAALRDARDAGYRTAVLVASEAGAGVYRRLGFRSYGHRYIYTQRQRSI